MTITRNEVISLMRTNDTALFNDLKAKINQVQTREEAIQNHEILEVERYERVKLSNYIKEVSTGFGIIAGFGMFALHAKAGFPEPLRAAVKTVKTGIHGGILGASVGYIADKRVIDVALKNLLALQEVAKSKIESFPIVEIPETQNSLTHRRSAPGNFSA